MRRSKQRDILNPRKILRFYPRFCRGICPFCSGNRELVVMNSASICGVCTKRFTDVLKDTMQRTREQKVKRPCLFCAARKWWRSEWPALLGKPRPFRIGRRFLHGTLGEAEVCICDGCIDYCQVLFSLRQSARASFEAELGPECGPERCDEPGCDRLRMKLAIRCLQHQFEGY
jgi:hypothetical protein